MGENKKKTDFDAVLFAASDSLVQQESDYLESMDVSEVRVPEKTEKRILRKMRNHGKTPVLRKCVDAFRNVAAVLVLAGCLSVMVAHGVGSLRGDIWSFVVKQVGADTYVYLETTAKVPSYIKEFKSLGIKPEGLVEKVLWQEYDKQIISYFRYEDDRSYDYLYSFTQRPVTKDPIAISSTQEYTKVEINGREALFSEQVKGRIKLTWHDDEYLYSLVCRDENVTLEELIKMAESVE